MRWMCTAGTPTVGSVFHLTRTFREKDIKTFVDLTGDSNPIHLTKNQMANGVTAKADTFVNGAFLNAVIAGIIGTYFPGYVVTTQQFRFPTRCQLDQEVAFTVQVQDLRKIVTVSYESKQGDRIVFEGSAKLFAVRK